MKKKPGRKPKPISPLPWKKDSDGRVIDVDGRPVMSKDNGFFLCTQDQEYATFAAIHYPLLIDALKKIDQMSRYNVNHDEMLYAVQDINKVVKLVLATQKK